MEFWTTAISLALIITGLAIAINANPIIQDIKWSIIQWFIHKPHLQGHLKYGFNCLICQGFWVSLAACLIIKISIYEGLTAYGIFVILVLILPDLTKD